MVGLFTKKRGNLKIIIWRVNILDIKKIVCLLFVYDYKIIFFYKKYTLKIIFVRCYLKYFFI